MLLDFAHLTQYSVKYQKASDQPAAGGKGSDMEHSKMDLCTLNGFYFTKARKYYFAGLYFRTQKKKLSDC